MKKISILLCCLTILFCSCNLQPCEHDWEHHSYYGTITIPATAKDEDWMAVQQFYPAYTSKCFYCEAEIIACTNNHKLWAYRNKNDTKWRKPDGTYY